MDMASGGASIGGTLLSMYGQSIKNKAQSEDYQNQLLAQTEQAKQATAEAAARNAVLGEYQGRQSGYIGANEKTLGDTIAAFSPEAQAARVAATTANRQGTISDAIGTLDPSKIVGVGGTGLTADAYRTSFGAADAKAHASGAARGALGAVADVTQRNGESIGEGNRGINTTNAVSRNDIASLGSAQDLAAFGTRKVIKQAAPANQGLGSFFQGLGNVMGSAAGSGAASSAATSVGNYFTPAPAPTSPFNTTGSLY